MANGAMDHAATGDHVTRRSRGRPAGSKNKPKPPIIITRESANTLRAHAMEVSPGCDVCESLANFARKKQCGISVLSATGCVTSVTLRQPSQSSGSGPIVTLHGQFEILSLIGSVLPPPAPPGVTGLDIYLAGPQGQLVGGPISGPLIAFGPVVIMAATFMNATFDRLTNEKDEPAPVTTVAHNQHIISVSEKYRTPQNLDVCPTTKIHSWSAAQPLSKT
ncbi:AT-hook motif nuclear-localized protein 16-like [Rutidosis leptorrhynchoides]|uniref:AT-hook motif nuclear-localized protein 16-like n=1 Tax=Rutidosis leptorrhynchoides TaxID=125765 RepID=UPI003A98D03E